MIRQPIVVCVGHIDHGKSSILDRIRGSAIVASEAGGITQCISCSSVPLPVIQKICGKLLEQLKLSFTIPGLLFIDTPGHAAFTHLRKRGGNLADIAILVIDINEGFMPQTLEALEILKQYKTPFVVAANKIDRISGWKSNPQSPLLADIKLQTEEIQAKLDQMLYNLVGKFSELGIQSERFDRIEDFTKQAAIIPTCAKTGEGIPELLMMLTGLAQKYLEGSLQIDNEGRAKGTVLEVKKEKGLGCCLDVIVYDGTLRKGDTIVIGTLGKPIVTRIRALFVPDSLVDMREKSSKFKPVDQVTAATGVKISALDIDEVLGGMPLRSAGKDVDSALDDVQKEVEEVLIETDQEGIIIKADTLGALEALLKLLKEKGIGIKRASIGEINRKDILEAMSNKEHNVLEAVVLGFNIGLNPDAEDVAASVKVITNNVIYRLIGDYEAWVAFERKRIDTSQLQAVSKPCKLLLLRGYVFRQSNPAIVGAEIIAGLARPGMQLMKDGPPITVIKQMQLEKESVSSAEKGQQVAIALEGITMGRQLREGDTLYSFLNEDSFRKLKDLKKNLSDEEIQILKEIATIMRKDSPMWGV